jgi:hypothetical protein
MSAPAMSGTSSGYSGTPLPRKLGIAEGDRICVLREPEGFRDTLGMLPDGVRVSARSIQDADVIVAFFKRRAKLNRDLPRLMDALDVDGGLWISWPKRTSGVETDITEDTVREIALPLGLVDNKVCAIDQIWSGLRLVFRKENRAAVRKARG